MRLLTKVKTQQPRTHGQNRSPVLETAGDEDSSIPKPLRAMVDPGDGRKPLPPVVSNSNNADKCTGASHTKPQELAPGGMK